MSRSRPKLSHRLEFAVYRGLGALLAGLPMGSCTALGRGLGLAFHHFGGKYRRLVRRNLRVATADRPPGPAALDALVRETFQRVGANVLASLKTPTFADRDAAHPHFSTAGLGILKSNHRDGFGTVVVLPHMGNWEALTQIDTPFPAGGIYRPLSNPLMDDLIRRRRTADGSLLFSRKDGFHAPSAFLRGGGALAVLSDQRAGGRGTAMPFFGKLTTCPPLPELLARRGKARVAALAVVTAGPARWELRVREVPRPTTAAILRGIEAAIRESPADVFWFHDRWRTDSRRPLSLFTALDPRVAATASVPLRLLFTAPADATADELRAFVGSMAAHRPDLRLDQLVRDGDAPVDHPLVAAHRFDDSLPREQLDGLLERVDNTHPGPLDGALCFGGESDLARAARRFGLRCVIGLDVRGKPWTHSYERPRQPGDWRGLADAMAEVPRRRRP